MKVLFTADLHIKIGQKNVPKMWALNRYKILFEELKRVALEYNVDLEIHGGDIFDKRPNLLELSTYLMYLGSIKHRLVVYDGNHEATKKGSTFFTELKDIAQGLNTGTTVILDYYKATKEIPFDILPYCKLKEFEKEGYGFSSKILLTHVRGSIPPHVLPEVDLDIFDRWDIVFAGDLHAHSNSQGNIVYPGSPVTVSFHRAEVDTGCIIIDTKDMSWEWVKLNVPQLIRKRVHSQEDMLPTEYNHTIYELEGDAVDLAGISNDLLDKKIIITDEEATLKLENKTVPEELDIYLREVVCLNSEKVKTTMEYFNDYIKET